MSNQRILRLRGLPWSAEEDDVREFLQSQPAGEVFIRRRGELSTGEAYVEFPSNEDANSAQAAFNREMLGGRYIEIFLAEAETMEEVKEKIREQDTGWVVRLRGLPFKATQEDVVQFFTDIEVLRGIHGVTLIYGRDGRPLGEAYVELPDEDSQIKALHLDRERMGARYIEVFKSTKADLNVRLQSARKNEGMRRQSWAGPMGLSLDRQLGLPGATPGMMMVPYATLPTPGIPTAPTPAALRLRGLPGDATNADVAQFLSESGIAPATVQIAPEQAPDGSLLGSSIAHAVFASPAHADVARQQTQHRLFRDRPLEVTPAPLPTGVSGMSSYQAQAMPISPTGMWSYSPVGYVYDDLSKLIASRSGQQLYPPSGQPRMPLPNPMGYAPPPNVGPGPSAYGMQAPGSPSMGRLPSGSLAGGLGSMGQRGVFSPRPLGGMVRAASPMSMSQQQQWGLQQQQQQQLLFLRHQQQQFLLQQQQAARMQSGPWSSPSNLMAPGQYAQPLRGSVQGGLLQGQRLGDPQIQQHLDPAVPSDSQGLQDRSIALSETAPRSGYPQFDTTHAPTHSQLPDLQSPIPSQSGRPLSHEQSFAAASNSDLSERHSHPMAQNLSLASLHLSDRAPSGRSPAASTTASVPSPSDGVRRSSTLHFGGQSSPDILQ